MTIFEMCGQLSVFLRVSVRYVEPEFGGTNALQIGVEFIEADLS